VHAHLMLKELLLGWLWLGRQTATGKRPTGFIFKGSAVGSREFEFFVQVSVGGTLDCGGSLIDTLYVLNAGHCTEKPLPWLRGHL
jgi:secreted trypsin-like serine protease